MKLLSVGDKVFNLDLVTDFAIDGDNVTVVLAGALENLPGSVRLETRTLHFSGEAGAALRQWLERNAEDATQPPPLAQPDSIQASLDQYA